MYLHEYNEQQGVVGEVRNGRRPLTHPVDTDVSSGHTSDVGVLWVKEDVLQNGLHHCEVNHGTLRGRGGRRVIEHQQCMMKISIHSTHTKRSMYV